EDALEPRGGNPARAEPVGMQEGLAQTPAARLRQESASLVGGNPPLALDLIPRTPGPLARPDARAEDEGQRSVVPKVDAGQSDDRGSEARLFHHFPTRALERRLAG